MKGHSKKSVFSTQDLTVPALRLFKVFPARLQPVAAKEGWLSIQQPDDDSPSPSFRVLEKLNKDPPARHWGAVCWRFTEATGLTSAQVSAVVEASPDFDLFLCNPTPELEGAYANLWMQGNTVHPRLMEAAKAFFLANTWDQKMLFELQPSSVFSGSQYLIGNDRFWSSYVPFVRQALDQSRRKIPRKVLRWMSQSLTDPRDPMQTVTYWPLIIERLLPVFLKRSGKELRVTRITAPAGEKRLNIHLRRLREMKDVAHQTKSTWLGSCWMHYRNSYFLNVIDRTWCKTHLPLLTQESMDFY